MVLWEAWAARCRSNTGLKPCALTEQMPACAGKEGFSPNYSFSATQINLCGFLLTISHSCAIVTTEVVNTVAQELTSLLGLTEYEGRIYLSLLQAGPLTGYAIAKASGVPASKSYEAVEGLARKGGAITIPGDPLRHAAVPPDTLLAYARQQHVQALEALSDSLAKVAQAAAIAEVPSLWRANADAGLAQIASRIGASQHTLLGALPLTARGFLEPALAEAAHRGVLVQILGSGDEQLTLLLDDREAIIATLSNPAEVIGSGNPALIALCRTRLRTAASSPYLRPAQASAEWLRWEEQKGLRLLKAGQ